jgi:hypothetical protein
VIPFLVSYYQPPTAGKFKLDPPLPPYDSLTLGYGAGNSNPYNYVLRDGQNVDVGHLKLFLATEPIDFSSVPQLSPFKQDARAPVSPPMKAPLAWGTILLAIVQRREPLPRAT